MISKITLKNTLHKFKMESQLQTIEDIKTSKEDEILKAKAKGQICQRSSFKYCRGDPYENVQVPEFSRKLTII